MNYLMADEMIEKKMYSVWKDNKRVAKFCIKDEQM